MVWWRMKVRKTIGGHNPPWMLVSGGGEIMPMPTEIEADVNIYIVIDYYNREHAEIR